MHVCLCVCVNGGEEGGQGREGKAERDIGDKYSQRECSRTREEQHETADG